MKTLIFNGSPRKDGETKHLLKELVNALEGEYKMVDAYDCNIKPCIDCRACWKVNGCSQKDEWEDVDAYIKQCDNIVIASPVYFSELTGQLLNAVSKLQTYWSARFIRKEEPVIKPKKGGIILCCGGTGPLTKPIETASFLLHEMNAYDIYTPACFPGTDLHPAGNRSNAVNGVRKIAAFFNNRS